MFLSKANSLKYGVVLGFISGLVHLFPDLLMPLVSAQLLFGFSLQNLVGLLTVILLGMALLKK